jgi:hypothetical protein
MSTLPILCLDHESTRRRHSLRQESASLHARAREVNRRQNTILMHLMASMTSFDTKLQCMRMRRTFIAVNGRTFAPRITSHWQLLAAMKSPYPWRLVGIHLLPF